MGHILALQGFSPASLEDTFSLAFSSRFLLSLVVVAFLVPLLALWDLGEFILVTTMIS